jgi:hypothetical protein
MGSGEVLKLTRRLRDVRAGDQQSSCFRACDREFAPAKRRLGSDAKEGRDEIRCGAEEETATASKGLG